MSNFKFRLLEGSRSADSNSPLTFPAKSVESDSNLFQSKDSRADYLVWVSGDEDEYDIGSPNLKFEWSKNEPEISRFDWDGFSGRWNTMPGTGSEQVGVMGQSEPITVPVPSNLYSIGYAPYSIYIGQPERDISFTWDLVATDDDFTVPAPASVQISVETGHVKFSDSDLSNPLYMDKPVYVSRQSFFDRQVTTGQIGVLPALADSPVFIFLHPIPGSGQKPRVQIGNRPFLTPIRFSTETSTPIPDSQGVVHWSEDTGKLVFHPQDVADNSSRPVFYRGVSCGECSLSRIEICAFPNPPEYPSEMAQLGIFVGLNDENRYVFFLEGPDSKRYYYKVSLSESDPSLLVPGFVYINSTSGKCFLSSLEFTKSWTGILYAIDTQMVLEDGISLQLFRSGASSVGYPTVADFKKVYSVQSQVLTNNIQSSPLFLLPTLPQEDDSLLFSVKKSSGSSGTFVGDLNRAEDSSLDGLCAKVDFGEKSLVFANRKNSSVILAKPDYSFICPNPAILDDGFEVTKGGQSLDLGRDFLVNKNGGLVEFVTPKGLGDPNTVSAVRGSASGHSVSLQQLPQDLNLVGKYYFIYSGVNSGIYKITSRSGSSIQLDGPILETGPVLGDIVPYAEDVVSRVWGTIQPPYKKITIYRISGEFSYELTNQDFSVLPTTGQVSFTSPVTENQKYRIVYSYFQEDENGVLGQSIKTEEYAQFPIFQETATIEHGKARFNPSGYEVVNPSAAKVYVNGVSLSDFRLENNTIECGQVFTNENITINYFVSESQGGETSISLTNRNLDIDFPQVFSNIDDNNGYHLVLNGSHDLGPDSVMLLDNTNVYAVQVVTYDSESDQTRILFRNQFVVDIVNPQIKYTTPISLSKFIPIGFACSSLLKGTKQIRVSGDIRSVCTIGTICKVQSDYFLIGSVEYKENESTSVITFTSDAQKGYVIPDLMYSSMAVLEPTQIIQTKHPLVSQVEPAISKYNSLGSDVLSPGVDYTIDESGSINLTDPVQIGDSIRCIYLARRLEPAGSKFDISFAYQIAPDSINGVQNQTLVASYNLYNPDSFYFRVETVETYLPDLIEYISQSPASGTTSGPATGNNYSSKIHNNGVPSPWFEETRLANMDRVASQVLLVYNDVINGFEDFLSNLDGRAVGGADGKFRFDGELDNPIKTSYNQVTNDIDDRIRLNEPFAISFSTEPPGLSVQGGTGVVKSMWDTHSFSRFYPTEKRNAAVVLNDQTNGIFDFNATLGSFGIESILSHEPLISTKSRLAFSLLGPGLMMVSGDNGDGSKLVPPVKANQVMEIYTDTGLRIESDSLTYTEAITVTVTAVSPAAGGWFVLYTPSDGIPIQYGSILRSVEDTDNDNEFAVHMYTDDYVNVNHGDGAIKYKWTPGPLSPDGKVWGKEIVSSTISFVNKDSSPRRPSVFDGGTLLDNGQISEPLITHENEIRFLNSEKRSIPLIYRGSASGSQVLSPTATPVIGDVYKWITGLNSGTIFTYLSSSGSNWNTSATFTATSTELFVKTSTVNGPYYPRFDSELSGIQRVLDTNIETEPYVSTTLYGSDEFVGSINSEFNSLLDIVQSASNPILSSTGVTTLVSLSSDSTLTDSSIEFGVDYAVEIGDLVVISDRSTFGIYKITNVDPHELTVSNESPFVGFRSATTVDYTIVRKMDFFSDEFWRVLARCIDFTHQFWVETNTWISGLSSGSDFSHRMDRIDARLVQIRGMIQEVQSLLAATESLYDSRFSWIQQRIDRKEGLVFLKILASARRQEAIQKIRTTQLKLKTLQNL